ncbi:hypothetical protein PHYPO_G00188540 [Pangasianodon hypophthalmus]|uniref:C-C motif chemokine n=1 Tax=Pangasianodon hypophthalmus TaxID=310915 RepID=A0A5N5PHF2_PANHP|nr:C-C motif chemokine 4 homolog [Pangasianodon hypophthalmus]KAB5578965.1 hypothetical protein PHYPO_G00188540 [Pangasianodon hypophthalmus]
MFSRSLLLVLLVLACIQSFTMAHNANAPDSCCFTFHMNRIPVKVIEKYKETRRECPKAGVVFILKSGRQVCADSDVEWVRKHMNTIDQRLFASLTQNQPSA